MVDGLSDTAVTVTADGAEKTLSVYVTSYAPYELSAIAGMFGDVVPTVRVFGSNDYALAEWKEIRLSKNAVDNEGFTTIKTVDMDITKTEEYRFFRVDMTIAEGEFSVAELVMYRPEGKMLIPVYAEGDGLSVDAEIIGYKEPGSEEIVQLPKKPAVVRKPFEIRLRPTAKPYKVEKLSK